MGCDSDCDCEKLDAKDIPRVNPYPVDRQTWVPITCHGPTILFPVTYNNEPVYFTQTEPTSDDVTQNVYMPARRGVVPLYTSGDWYVYVNDSQGVGKFRFMKVELGSLSDFLAMMVTLGLTLPVAISGAGGEAPTGNFDSTGQNEAGISAFVRAALTAYDNGQSAGVANVPLNASVLSSSDASSEAVRTGLWTLALGCMTVQGGTSALHFKGVQGNGAQTYTNSRLQVDGIMRGDDGVNYSAAHVRGNNATKNANIPRAGIGVLVNARPPVADQCVSATAASGTGVTATLPAPGANLRQYITRIQIVEFAAALLTAAATPVLVTTTNIPGTPTFSFPAAATAQGAENVFDEDYSSAPIEASADNTAVTVVAPGTTSVIWRINVWYYNN